MYFAAEEFACEVERERVCVCFYDGLLGLFRSYGASLLPYRTSIAYATAFVLFAALGLGMATPTHWFKLDALLGESLDVIGVPGPFVCEPVASALRSAVQPRLLSPHSDCGMPALPSHSMNSAERQRSFAAHVAV